ncbi:DUF4238 domain-containing protein [Photobacterium satsumensis]|uniref:DUF4238 domain-containing protein n=1 Tax=Photobacterium satsumensis TaxID=2910239 RepID=UPI003D1218C0
MDKVTKNTPKKQHYVPQFLLRNFSIEGKEQLFTYDKQREICFSASIRDSASENGFYNITRSGDKLTFEHKLSKLETISSDVITKICDQETVEFLTDDEHQILCIFAASLLIRVKRQREFVSQLNSTIVDFVRRFGFEPNEIENFDELNCEQLDAQHVGFLSTEILNIANKFGDKAVGLLKAPDNHSFIIADNPVVMFCHKPNRFMSKGVSVLGVEIYLPISKQLCLSFLCMDFYHELVEKLEFIDANQNNFPELKEINVNYATKLVSSIQSGKAEVIDDSSLNFINSIQIVDSFAYIYSDNNNFDQVKQIINKNPSIKSGNVVKIGI